MTLDFFDAQVDISAQRRHRVCYVWISVYIFVRKTVLKVLKIQNNGNKKTLVFLFIFGQFCKASQGSQCSQNVSTNGNENENGNGMLKVNYLLQFASYSVLDGIFGVPGAPLCIFDQSCACLTSAVQL